MGGVISQPPQLTTGASSMSAAIARAPGSASQSFLSYFNIKSTPDLTHTHTRPAGPATIRAVARILTGTGIPLEIAQRILDEARYWSKCTRANKKPCTVIAGMDPPRQARGSQLETWTSGQEDELIEEMEIRGGGLRGGRGQIWYLASSPIGCKPRSWSLNMTNREAKLGQERDQAVWIREILVQTVSRDQGWSDDAAHYGTYDASYSWFDLSLLRDGMEVPHSRTKIQYNIHAGQYSKYHYNVFDHKHPFVAMAREGDRIVLWGRAEYPGWTNTIKEAAISVYTAPFPTP